MISLNRGNRTGGMVRTEILLGGRIHLVFLNHLLSTETSLRNVFEPIAALYSHNIVPDLILMHDKALHIETETQ